MIDIAEINITTEREREFISPTRLMQGLTYACYLTNDTRKNILKTIKCKREDQTFSTNRKIMSDHQDILR